MPSTESLKERLLGHGCVRRGPSPNQLRSQLRLLDIYNPAETNQAHRPVKNHTPVCRCQSAQSLCRCEERMTKGLEPTNNAGSVRFVLLVESFSLGCPVCAHFVHYTSRRNRVPPRRGFRVEVQ